MRLNASRTSKRRVSGAGPTLILFYYIQANRKRAKKIFVPAANSKRGPFFFPAKGEFEKQFFIFVVAYGEPNWPQQFFAPAAKKVARPKVGHMYQDTEFSVPRREILHKQRNQENNFMFQTFGGKKIGKIWNIKKLREESMESVEKKLPGKKNDLNPSGPQPRFGDKLVGI